MNINKNCRLFLRDIYLYDIEACHYTILERLGFDLSNIDKSNKEKRNIQIGKLMSQNPRLTDILRKTTNSIVDENISRNNVTEDELILRQYDGIIITRILQETIDQSIPLDLRSHFEIFIISTNRNKYIAFDGIKTTIKGVPHRYEKIDKLYRRIAKINFNVRSSIFENLQEIKDEILTSNDPELYCVPVSDDKYSVFLKGYEEVEITKQTVKMMDVNDVDRRKYFDFYLRPFTESITVEFV